MTYGTRPKYQNTPEIEFDIFRWMKISRNGTILRLILEFVRELYLETVVSLFALIGLNLDHRNHVNATLQQDSLPKTKLSENSSTSERSGVHPCALRSAAVCSPELTSKRTFWLLLVVFFCMHDT